MGGKGGGEERGRGLTKNTTVSFVVLGVGPRGIGSAIYYGRLRGGGWGPKMA